MRHRLQEKKGGDNYGSSRKEDTPKIHCVHCNRECGNLSGGFARFTGLPVCSRPVDPDRPDCYRMITMKFHKVQDCPECMAPGPTPYPSPPRIGSRLN
jgi:hypothetical protein